jgi:predicted RNA methylase
MKQEQKPFAWELKSGGPELYEQYIVPVWMAEWAQVLINASNISLGERVLDIACGTGIVARNAAALVGSEGRVAGI